MNDADLAASVWRLERSRLIGAAAKLLHDLDEAEDCAQDALIAALETWPRDGQPNNAAAWLMTTTRNRALDRLRRRQMLAREHEALAADDEAAQAHVTPDFVPGLDLARERALLGDEQLRLIFIACHPVLAPEARVAFHNVAHPEDPIRLCACWAGWRLARLPAPSWCPRPRWHSASCGPRRRWWASPMSCRRLTNGPNA